MTDHFEHIAKACDKVLYFLSGSITLGGLFDVLDSHQWIIGLVIGIATLLMKYHFEKKHLALLMRQQL